MRRAYAVVEEASVGMTECSPTAVDLALRALLRLRQQGRIRELRGRLDWQGDLEAMRTDA